MVWFLPSFHHDKWTRSSKKLKNRAFLTLLRSQKHYVIFSNNVLRETLPGNNCLGLGLMQRRLDTVRNAAWVNNPMRFTFTRALVAFGSLTRRPNIRLKRNVACIFDINAGHQMFFCPTVVWITLTTHDNRRRQQNHGFFWSIESQCKDELKRDRPNNRDPTNADRSLQLFPLHILPLCNVWQRLNTCASRIMQDYASNWIALNKSRLKILAHVSLNANLLQAVCYCLHLILCLWLKSSTLLFYGELKRHCLCTVPTCHICIIAWEIVIISTS